MSDKKVSIVISQGFRFAHRGCDVVEYQAAAEPVRVDADVAELAIAEKWAKPAKEAKPAKAEKAIDAAPQNKDAGQAPENKSE